jgi:hypothetical protein
VFPDRVDFPFVSEEDPLDPGVPLARLLLGRKKFEPRDWSSDWLSWLVLIEFSEEGWKGAPDAFNKEQKEKNSEYKGVFGALLEPSASLEEEIAKLVEYAEDERPDALGEILAQDGGFVAEFHNLLGIAPTSYPATRALLAAAGLVGGFVGLHYKWEFHRPRPSQVAPALRPPLPLPGHASFPSGHALQAWMMATAASEACGAGPKGKKGTIASALFTLADRIARNREIAGLHYPSDSAASKELARCMYPLLRGTARFGALMEAAEMEWKPADEEQPK